MKPVYSFVAYSGTGKTTLIEKIIPVLKSFGLRVAVMKHDAHEFQVDVPGKDSWRMTRAGADTVIIANDTHAAVMENRPVSPEKLLETVTDADVIITEGYKTGKWKKIGLARLANGKGLPPVEGEYFATASDYLPEGRAARHFSLENAEAIARLIYDDIKKGQA